MAKRTKNQKKSLWFPLAFGLAFTVSFTWLMAVLVRGKDVALLNPKGVIADEQSWLLITSTSIMLAFAAIVLFFIYYFAWRYRETDQDDKKPAINPNAGRNKLLMATAWASPIFIFIVLAALMLPATQRLEPQRSIEADREEITIRVVAMRWKWLFMYPEHDIATVNHVHIPVDTPVRFELTADEAPMQSFWIPHLGGMLYAMTEHINPLNLMAHTLGDYDGGAAEINGHGFSGMRFTARVSSQADFDAWVSQTSSQSAELDAAEYARLLEPSEDTPTTSYYSPSNRVLFDNLIKKYAGSHDHSGSSGYEEGHH